MSYGGKSVYRRDMRRVMCWFMGVCECASHADELKNGGRLKYICASRTHISTIRNGYMCSSLAALHVSLTRPRLSHSLANTPCTTYHGSDVLL